MITGGCLCGAVRFRSTEGPIAARICWCKVCQKIGAGGPTVGAAFRTATFTIEGTLKDYPSVADSGNRMHRRFCPVCGTHLFSEAEARPHLVFVRAGALDDPEIIRPTATIWTASAPSWACIDADLPRIEGQPPPVAQDQRPDGLRAKLVLLRRADAIDLDEICKAGLTNTIWQAFDAANAGSA